MCQSGIFGGGIFCYPSSAKTRNNNKTTERKGIQHIHHHQSSSAEKDNELILFSFLIPALKRAWFAVYKLKSECHQSISLSSFHPWWTDRLYSQSRWAWPRLVWVMMDEAFTSSPSPCSPEWLLLRFHRGRVGGSGPTLRWHLPSTDGDICPHRSHFMMTIQASFYTLPSWHQMLNWSAFPLCH